MPITIKSEREIELMTEAGRILGIVHKELEKALKPGMSTLDIDALGCMQPLTILVTSSKEAFQ